MKKQMLFMFMPSLLSGVLIGCHKPVNAVILLPKNGEPTIYAEAGGRLEFRSEVPSFVITWSGPNPCIEKELAGTRDQSVICSIPKRAPDGEYTFIVSESQVDQAGQVRPVPPTQHVLSIKSCPAPCHPSKTNN